MHDLSLFLVVFPLFLIGGDGTVQVLRPLGETQSGNLWCYQNRMPLGALWVEEVSDRLSGVNSDDCVNLDLMMNGFIKSTRDKCPANPAFRHHMTRHDMMRDLRRLLRRDDGCIEAEFNYGGMCSALRDKCPNAAIFNGINDGPCLAATTPATKIHAVPTNGHMADAVKCMLCCNLLEAMRNEPTMDTHSTCEKTVLFVHKCNHMAIRHKKQFSEMTHKRYANISVSELCHGMKLCSLNDISEIRQKKLYPVISATGVANVSSAQCTLCFGVAMAEKHKAALSHKDAMEFYCNQTDDLIDICNRIKANHGEAMKTLFSLTPNAGGHQAFQFCKMKHFCEESHRKLFAELEYMENMSPSQTKLARIPIVALPRTARTTILDPIKDIFSGTDAIIELNFKNEQQVREIFSQDLERQLKWLAKYGLISNTINCPDAQCMNQAMSFRVDSNCIDGYRWKCSNPCTSTASVRQNSFFEHSMLSIKQIMLIVSTWANIPTLTIEQIRQHIGPNDKNQLLSPNTVIEWNNIIRDVCELWCEGMRPFRRLGGPDTIVEIDESLIYRRKYHRGRLLHQNQGWVFGMVERRFNGGSSNNVILEPVDRRDAATLLPIIQRWIQDDTIIMSDSWGAYFRLGQLPQNYIHHAVNHRQNFVRPAPAWTVIAGNPAIPIPVHTQTIETTWRDLKDKLKNLRGTSEALWPTYMFQYMFRKAHNGENIFGYFWLAVSQQYEV